MVTEFGFVNIREILNRVMRHPLLSNLNLEMAIHYATDFIACMGLPKTYVDKISEVEIEDHRGMLPCDLVQIEQVRNKKNGFFLVSMTGNFRDDTKEAQTFKTQGRMIYTSFEKGLIEISYKAMPVDDEGLPLLPDNAVFLRALESYIKKEWFTVLFDLGKININVLQNAQREYAFNAGQCNNEFMIPSVSEMQAITGILNQLVPRWDEFHKGFRDLGNKEYIRIQR